MSNVSLIDGHIDEVPKHYKKSTAKGKPCSDHKHQYETVLLTWNYPYTDVKTGKQVISKIQIPTKVCTICGRIGESDLDNSYYDTIYIEDSPYKVFEKKLNEKALALPRWVAENIGDSFAVKEDR